MRVLVGCLIVLAGCSTQPSGLDVTPTDPPTQQDYLAMAGGMLALSWHNPSDRDFAQTMVVRYDARPDGKPIRGTIPKAGEMLGQGLVRFAGKSESFVDDALPDLCRAYIYELWSVDQAGNWSVGPAQLPVSRGAATVAPTTPPTAMTVVEVDGDVLLAWTNPPASTGWTELRVIRKFGTAPASPTDGIAVFTGKTSSAAEPVSGMGTGKWVYGVFACNSCGLCNKAPATVAFSHLEPRDGGDGGTGGGGGGGGGPGPLTPTDVAVMLSADGKNVQLAWTNPAQVNSVKVLRVLNAEPLGPGDADATSVFIGSSSTASERVDLLLPDVPVERKCTYSSPRPATPRVYRYRVYGCRNGSCESTGAGAPLALTIAQALRAGGYTLFWRHAWADVCGDQVQLGPASNTTSPNWWKSCDRACLTTALARQLDLVHAPNETATIHTQFANKGFAIGKVLTSEFCRARETAQGFNFGPAIEQNQTLTYFVYAESQRCPNTMAMLNVAPTSGTNTAMVSHAGFVCPILAEIFWSEAAIFRPDPAGSPLFIQCLTWDAWAGLP